MSAESRNKNAKRRLPSGVTRGQSPRDRPCLLLASQSLGLRCAMRRKRPVRATVAREVCVATEMTYDLEGSSGHLGLSGGHSRCYGNHVPEAFVLGPVAAQVCSPRGQRSRRGVPVHRGGEGVQKNLVPAHRCLSSPHGLAVCTRA